MENNFIDTVLHLYRENKWQEILKINEYSESQIARRLLWVWPSEENLVFIGETLRKHNLCGIISLGCGCGLLEWFIQQSLGIPVVGYEINQSWWKSKYSGPQFISLEFPVLPLNGKQLDNNYALLFCYFNNRDAFTDYVNHYKGAVVFIIGPGEGRGTHSDPEPFRPNFNSSKWLLSNFQEVKNTKDFIAVYVNKS